MAFSIELQPEAILDDSGDLVYYGRIVVGDFEEDFLALGTFWRATDYQLHWRQSLHSLARGAATSCLITSYQDPTLCDYLFWWVLYREEQHVALQNQILFFNQLKAPFDVGSPALSVRPRETVNDDGRMIAEWSVPLTDILAFVAIAFP